MNVKLRMHARKMTAGEKFPDLHWNTVLGNSISPAQDSGWRILIVYRGKHCPLCKQYLNLLNELFDDFQTANINVSAISADTKEKAEAQFEEDGLKFPIGYDLSIDQMRRLGLYISEPRSIQETDRPFAEPGMFVVNPEGNTQIIDVSNAPFSRPDLKSLLKGLEFVMSNNYPVRGTMQDG